VRRQIIQWRIGCWIVLDSFEDPQRRPLRVLWTGAPETSQAAAGERAFVLHREGSPIGVSLAVEGAPGIEARPLRGSREPFGGWVAHDRSVSPAPAVDLRVPAGWALTTLALSSADSTTARRARMLRFNGPLEWTLQVPLPDDGSVTLTRRGAELAIDEPAGRRAIALAAPDAVSREVAAIERAGDSIRTEFPRFRPAIAERRQRSWMLAGAWFVTCAALVGRALRRRGFAPGRSGAAA
jgi:hypothetical protein